MANTMCRGAITVAFMLSQYVFLCLKLLKWPCELQLQVFEPIHKLQLALLVLAAAMRAQSACMCPAGRFPSTVSADLHKRSSHVTSLISASTSLFAWVRSVGDHKPWPKILFGGSCRGSCVTPGMFRHKHKQGDPHYQLKAMPSQKTTGHGSRWLASMESYKAQHA